MRDEPEMRNCFQCEVSLNMSLAKKGILLVNDYSHEEFGTAELGRDAGIRPGQPEVNLVPRRSSSHLWFYRGSDGRVGEMPGEAVRRSDNRRLRAQGLYVLGREIGAQAPPPFPAPYPPLTGAYRKEKVSGRNATLLSRTCPGSSRIGNKLWLRAHLALESKFISRLIYGLENAGVAVGRRERTMRSKATAGLSLLSKLAQHFRRVQAPAFRRRQSSPQPLAHLRQRSLVEDLEALDIEAVKLPFTRFGARPSSSATDAYRRAEDVLRKVAHDRFRGHAAVNWVAGLDVNVDRFIAPADLNHLGHPEYPARRSGQ